MNQSQAGFKGLDRSVRMQRIIDAAIMLFHKKGYKATTLDHVARELGLSKAALYNYVSSKEELLSLIYKQAFEKIFQRIYEIASMNVSAVEKLRLIIRNHIENIITQNPAMFSVFFGEENQLPKKEFVKIREQKREYTEVIEKIIEEGISAGIFKKVEPRLQAYAILGMCNWVFKWYRPEKEVHSPAEIAEFFIALIESGCLASDVSQGGQKVKGIERENADRVADKRQVQMELSLLRDQLSTLIDKLNDQ